MKVEWRKVMKEELDTFKDDFNKDLKKDIVEMKNSFNISLEDMEKKNLDMQIELTATKNKLNGCQIQVSELVAIMSRQDQMIAECKNQIDLLRAKVSQACIFIQGLVIRKDDDCVVKVKDFFQMQLKIEEEIKVRSAIKIGGDQHLVKVELKNSCDKGIIFCHVKHLKGVVNEFDRKYRIESDLPPKMKEQKKEKDKLGWITPHSMLEIN